MTTSQKWLLVFCAIGVCLLLTNDGGKDRKNH